MNKNNVKRKYQEGKQSLGTFLSLGSGTVAEALGISGIDYFIIDTEHSPFDLQEALTCVKSAELKDITPFARIKHIDRGNVLKMLDIGIQGLIIPAIKTKEEVQKIIEFGKYQPIGNRGFCPTRCCEYGYRNTMKDGIKTYCNTKNEEIMIIPQCETKECLENIEEIVNLEGVDGIFIGPFDLSIALGKPAAFQDPEIIQAFEKVLQVCKKAQKPIFIFAPNLEATKLRLTEGFDSVTYSSDVNMLIDSYTASIHDLKDALR